MDVQVTDSVIGAFVPQFLLNFEENSSLQNYFRQVLKTNYQKGIISLDFGHCQSCCSTLTFHERPRIKPSQFMTRKVRKLLARSEKRHLGKYHAHLVQKFLRSSTQLTVRCPSCNHVNKTPVISNEAKLTLKKKLLTNSEATPELAVSTVKKRKKKKKRTQKDDNSGLIIPGANHDQSKSAAEVISSPMEASEYLPLIPDRFSTPLSTKRLASATYASAKTPSNSTPARSHLTKGIFSTPFTGKLPGSHSNFGQKSQQKGSKVVSSNLQTNKKIKHKQLQEFLSQESSAVKKPASLSDFLSSL